MRKQMFCQRRPQGVGRTRATVRPICIFCIHLQSLEETQDCRLVFSEFTCISAPSLAAAVLNSDLSVKTFRLVAGFAFSAWVRSPKVAFRLLGELAETMRVSQCSCCGRWDCFVSGTFPTPYSLRNHVTFNHIFMYPAQQPWITHIS